MSLNKSAEIILKDCMSLKRNESCLIITDKKLKSIGNVLYKNALKITKPTKTKGFRGTKNAKRFLVKAKIILTTIPEAHGTEPPKYIADEMLHYDAILIPTTKSLSHTRARKNAIKMGARIASMPGITIDMMKRALNVDFNKIKKTNKNLISKLKNKNKIRIATKKGTNIEFYIKGRKWLSDDGIYIKKKAFGNLPAGEVFIAPLENKTNGVIVVDASIGGIGKVDKSIGIIVKNGLIVDVNGRKVANKFKNLLKNKLYKNVAELGIGTNYKAKVTGNVLEDEKVAGTCHIAFGNNKHFGGKVDVPFHVDVVIKKPTIYANNVLVMEDGKLIK